MATSGSGKYHGDGKYKKEEDTMVMVNATKQKDIENNAKTFSTDAFMQQDATMLDLARDDDKLDEVAAFWRGYADEAAKSGVGVQSHCDGAGDFQNHGYGKPSFPGNPFYELEQLDNRLNRKMHTDSRQFQAMIDAIKSDSLAAREAYRKHLEQQRRKNAEDEAAIEAYRKARERVRHCTEKHEKADAVVAAARLRRQYLERRRSERSP